MANNIFLTGPPKSGKSGVLERIIKELKKEGWKVGGIITPEVKKAGKRAGFEVIDVLTGEKGTLASIKGFGPTVGKYNVHIKGFELIALPALEKARGCDLVIIDEIGRMELFSKKFEEALEKLLKSPKLVLASLHEDYVSEYGANGKLLEVSLENRDDVVREVVAQLNRMREELNPNPDAMLR